uniref:Uncharacterized protein n=1 Tax=Tanacetum cinerariifolium TaxID=118510 RepID=A0A6L2L1R9_TANCI|nr:hypothetical protein [Tanacetum cinerariifolium]
MLQIVRIDFLQKYFKDITREDQQTFRVRLLQYLDELERLFDERSIALEDNLVAKESTYDSVSSSKKLDESSSLGNDVDAEKILVETVASGIKNYDIRPTYDSDTVSEVSSEAQQANALLTKELEKYKEKEKYFAKEMTNESEYYKKIKLLNEEISNFKSQACQKEKSFHKENEKYAQTDCSDFSYVISKEDNVNMGKKGLGFKIQNNVKYPFILNKAKELTPSLYNIDEMGKDLLSDHKIIF